MNMPFYVSPEQMMKDRADYARKGIARGRSLVAFSVVDGIVLVARVGHTRDASAQRLLYTLGRTVSTPVLGVVGNCASRKDAERYGFTWTSAAPRAQPKLIRR